MTGADGSSHTRFIAPHPRLQPYLSVYYFTAIDSLDGQPVRDLMNPEWASVRFRYRGDTLGGFVGGELVEVPPMHFAGPTSLAGPFAAVHARIASIGFLPVGWCMFIDESADNWSDRLDDASLVKTPVAFARMMEATRTLASLDDMAAAFDQILLDALDNRPLIDAPMEDKVRAAHAALLDPEITTVAGLADRLQMSIAQLQRLSLRIFGFPPKLLLRRQRLVRTLAVIMRDPESNWSDALDMHYYDQAHFNRDFRQFFKMSPREYRAQPHPIIGAASKARMAALGDPLQALQRPGNMPVP
ncbi:MAG: AraC family transcriptional regulator [Sphingomonadaceae bacterium]|nr:AraC family transcriptional regulator [Sphingomonadaceae bacterium]